MRKSTQRYYRVGIAQAVAQKIWHTFPQQQYPIFQNEFVVPKLVISTGSLANPQNGLANRLGAEKINEVAIAT